jgi:MFS family permease
VHNKSSGFIELLIKNYSISRMIVNAHTSWVNYFYGRGPMDTQCAAEARNRPVKVRTAKHRWKVLGVGVASNASFSAAAAGIPTTAIWLRADYHLTNSQLGMALGAIGLGVALSELPWGLATDRWGDRPILLTGLSGATCALLAMALFVAPLGGSLPTLHWLLLAMCLTGLLGGSVNGSSGRAVMRWFEEGERGLAMSIRQTAVPLGGGLGALVLPWLASNAGFGCVYGALALTCAASAVLAWRWLHEPPSFRVETPVSHNRAPGLFVNPLVWRVVLGVAALCAPQCAILTFSTVFLHDYGHVAIGGLTCTMVAIQVGAMALRIASGRHTDRHGNRRAYLRINTMIASASFALLALVAASGEHATQALLISMVILAGISVSAWHGVAYTELATLAGKDRAGTALGMANTGVYLGLFFTPLLIPHLLGVSSWSGVWLAAAAFAMLAYPLFPKAKRLHPTPAEA